MPTLVQEKDFTHFEKLNQRFKEQNTYLSSIVDQLTRIGHKLNDTNTPQLDTKESLTELQPYGDGHLVNFHYHLNEQAGLTDKINTVLRKLDEAI